MYCLWLLVIFKFLCVSSFQSQLNVPRVLLTYNTNFTLQVFGEGCFQWSSSRNEVNLEEFYNSNGCSKQAVVSAVTRPSTRSTSIILAKDIESGVSLRCDVIIDTIVRLEISTTTRELYAEEAPEEFIARAYDNKGNEFSSLEGIRFVWKIQNINSREATSNVQTILRFVTFEESPYAVPPAIGPLESVGDQGYSVLIEGRRTGQAQLSVKLAEEAYEDVPPSIVELMVLANLILEPQDVYILPYTGVQYSVWHLKQGILHAIDIEASQYYLKVTDDNICKLESDGINVSGIAEGSTQVVLKDNNVKALDSLKEPTANVHVVQPSYITIEVLPHNNPSLIVDNQYQFVVNIFDRNNHRISITENIVVETELKTEYFTTQFMSQNGTYVSATPIQTGNTKIMATLVSTIHEGEAVNFHPALTASLNLEILQAISVVPSFVVFAWDGIIMPTYKVNFTVDRYSEKVLWSSDHPSMASVSRTGQCTTSNKGLFTITASLNQNNLNKDTGKVLVTEALEMQLLESELETEVDESLFLPVALSTKFENNLQFFHMCHQLPFQIESEHNAFVATGTTRPSKVINSCVELEVQGKKVGFSTVEVSYESSSLKRRLVSETTLVVFEPLKVVNPPQSSQVVLALGASKIVTFEGGPLPWIKKPSFHFVTVSDEPDKMEATILDLPKKSRSDHYEVLVECQQLGEFTLTLSVGNKPSSTFPLPKTVSISLIVICAVPESIHLKSTLDLSQLVDCPILQEQNTLIALYKNKIPLEVEMFDGEGRKFDNFSSISFAWSVSDESLAALQQELASTKYNLRELYPHETAGEVIVTVTTDDYNNPNYQDYSLTNMKDSLNIRLVEETKLIPSNLVLFYHKHIKEEFIISGGSKHFALEKLQLMGVVNVKFMPEEMRIAVSPISDGNISIGLRDLCLIDAKVTEASVTVSSAFSIELVMRERVEVGSSILAEALVKDEAGNVIPVHSLMNLKSYPKNDVVEVSYEGTSKNGNGLFSVKGTKPGESSLEVSSETGRSNIPLIYSPNVPIHVFKPLLIQPRNITMIVGSVYQVETKDGPYPDSSVEFFIHNESIATTSNSGLIRAVSLGTTYMSVKSVFSNRNKYSQTISEDQIIVRVIPLDNIKIFCPIYYIGVGNSMPIHILGSESLIPPFYTATDPPLAYEWAISNEKLGSLTTVYYSNDILEESKNIGAIRFTALNAGRVTVSVKVKTVIPSQGSDKFQIINNIVLVDEVEIKIIDSFKLIKPAQEDAKILLSPNARTSLVPSRKGNKLTYKVDDKLDLVQIAQGTLTAKSSIGETSLLANVVDSSGFSESLCLLVEVRPIKYFQMLPEIFLTSNDYDEYSVLRNIPIGTTHVLKAQFHDSRGRTFTSTDAKVDFRLTRFDLINVKEGAANNTVTVTARESGETVIHFWLKDAPNVQDFIKVISGPGIEPHQSTIPYGDFVCFKSYVRDSKGLKGFWVSQDEDFELNGQTGIGRAKQIGKYSVDYHFGSNYVTNSEVQVLPISQIQIDSTNIHISNFDKEGGWFVPIRTKSAQQNSFNPNCFPSEKYVNESAIHIGCKLHLEGDISPQTLFDVSPKYVEGKGFGCLIESKSAPQHSYAFFDSDFILESFVEARGQQPEVYLSTPIKFSPSAVVDNYELNLSPENPTEEVLLLGMKRVLDSFIVLEEKGVRVDFESATEKDKKFRISAKEFTSSGSSFVQLSSTLTHQIIQIKVNFDSSSSVVRSGPKLTKDLPRYLLTLLFSNQSLLPIILFLVTIILLYMVYQNSTKSTYKQTQDTSVFVGSPPKLPHVHNVSCSPNSSTLSPLWSDDTQPIYGMPRLRSSPRPAYEGSPAYSP